MYLSLKRAAVLAVSLALCGLILTLPVAAQKKDSAKLKPYKDVVPADARTSTGFFSVHKVNDRYLLEIPDSLLGRDLLVVNRIVKAATGATPAKALLGGQFTYAGDEIGESVIRFEKLTEDKLFLKSVSFDQRSSDTSDNGFFRNLQNNNVQPIEAVFPIKAVNEAGHATVIDGTDFINSDNAILYFPSAIKTFLGITQVAADRSFIDHIQAFPMNIEIRTVKTYNTVQGPLGAPPPRTYELNSSVILLPRTPMQGRPADPRVGFFSDAYLDFDANPDGVKKAGNIFRWRMEPKLEDRDKYQRGELVEPAHPIVIYIDPLTPKKWVPYLIQGINDWQVAFEKAGFKNAIIGKESPVGDSTWSLEDARHSVLVYKPSEIENASGPSVHDPRSGEILETHINWYHNVMDVLYKWYFVQAAAVDPRVRKPRFDDSLMGELIRFVSSHEVGHTLGLMHNFGSSSTVPVEQLRNKAWVDAHGHTPSIMDYARFDYVAQPEDSIDENGLFPHIGDYDKWAIQWGYRYLPPMPAAAERDTLNRWIVNQLASGTQFFYGAQTDPLDPTNPQGFSKVNPDPRDQSEDLGDDAMKASAYGIKNLKRIEPHLLEWTYEPHEGYQRVGEMYQAVVDQYGRYMGHVLKNIGGVLITPRTVDQPGPVFVYNSRDKQQRALAFLNAQLFNTPAWLIDRHLYGLATVDFSGVAAVQVKTLDGLLDPVRIDRLIDQQTQEGAAMTYTATEMLHDLQQGVFGELSTGKPIDVYRRSLQKAYIQKLCMLVSPSAHGTNMTDDALSILKAHARGLEAAVKAASGRSADALTRDHLVDLGERLQQALKPQP
jgi:Met-zincin/Domain of unknown function (DUF5117)/Domain of unknown function (DUF5118)